jgi:hypothetical protein
MMQTIKCVLFSTVGLLLAGVLVVDETTGAPDEGEPQQQAAEQKLARPDHAGLFEVPKPMGFNEYCAVFGKQYATEIERLRREKIYTARQAVLLQSQIVYLIGAQDYFLGPTRFSDWTLEERARVCPSCAASQSTDEQVEGEPGKCSESLADDDGPSASLPLRASQTTTRSGRGPGVEITDLPSETGCFLPPKDQLNCDSCYAFVVMAALEYMYCRRTGHQVSFSEQYVIDCGNNGQTLLGCSGGHPDATLQFASDRGIYLTDDYRYAGVEQECSRPNGRDQSPFVLGSPEASLVPTTDWSEKLKEYVPVIVPASFPPRTDLLNYGNGILSPSGSGRRSDHLMLVVGLINDQRGEFYKLRNSWGPRWGDQGYLYVRTSARCFWGPGLVVEGPVSPRRG